MYSKLEIVRGGGESLFVGPGAFGVMPSRGAYENRKTVLKHALSDGAGLFTSRSVIDSFPEESIGDMPPRAEIEEFFTGLYGEKCNLSRKEIEMAFHLFAFVDEGAKGLSHPPKMKNIAFDYLYFLREGGCRAMIRAALGEDSRETIFTVWAGDQTVVATHEKVMGVLSGVSDGRNGKVSCDEDREHAREAVRRVLSMRVNNRSPKGLLSMRDILGDPSLGVEDLMKRYSGRRIK